METDFTILKTEILKRRDYGKDICLIDEQQIITLYGLPHVVKDIQQQFESINEKVAEKFNYVRNVIRSEPIKSEKPLIVNLPIGKSPIEKPLIEKPPTVKLPMEKPPIENSTIEKPLIVKPPTVKLPIDKPGIEKSFIENSPIVKSPIGKPPFEKPLIEKLSIETSPIVKLPIEKPPPEKVPIEKSRYFNIESSPKSSESATHPKIDQIITQKSQPRSIIFYVDEPGFEVLINQNFSPLLDIVNSKCLLDKQIIHQQIQIHIPKAKVSEFDDNTCEVQSQHNDSEPSNDSNETSMNSKNNWFLELFRPKKPKAQSSKPTSQGSATSTTNTTATVTIGKSKIIVCTGDLTKQAVSFTNGYYVFSHLYTLI